MQRGQTGASRHNNSNRGEAGDILVKKLTLPAGQVSSTAGGVIATNSGATAAAVQSLPASEWASFAARYQQFRVRSVTLVLEPRFPGAGNPVVTVGSHGALYVSDYIGSSVPANAVQILSDEGSLVTNTAKRVKFTVDWARNPNAKLWNPTSAALPVANSFGIAFASPSFATLVASTAYYDETVEWVVEFRGSQ